MGRVFFPTYRSNTIGVRDVAPFSQLGGMDGDIVIPRAPAEPYPRAANNPTQRMLGAIMANGAKSDLIRVYPAPVTPIPFPILMDPPYQPWPSYPAPRGGPVYPTPPSVGITPFPVVIPPAAPPVSAQGSPTPVVTMPVQTAPGTILVSSGGGTAAPATAPVTIQTGDSAWSAITAWLAGSTPIFSYNVPNVVLSGGVILLFAWLSSGKKTR